MNKSEFLQYIQQAVDGLEQADIDSLMPTTAQPDLYTIVQELVGLRGEVRRLSQAALKTNNDVQTMLLQQKNMLAESQKTIANLAVAPPPSAVVQSDYAENVEYKDLLKQIIEQDDMLQRTTAHLATLPEVGLFNLNDYRQKMASWKKGYEMTHQKWQQFVKSSGMYATGKVGEVFDPMYHEAIAVKSKSDQENNIILETETIGYIRGEKIIRRAKVVVNKKNESQNG
jgi:molecular chaperone GrpE (heat shock protein)